MLIEEDVFGREVDVEPSRVGLGDEKWLKQLPRRVVSDSISSLPEGQDDGNLMAMDRPRAKSHAGIEHQRPLLKGRDRTSLPTHPSKSLLISLSKHSGVVI